jgi:hypothetical protein
MSTRAAAEERMPLMDRLSPATPSSRLLAAAGADRDRIERELSRVGRRAEELARELQETVELSSCKASSSSKLRSLTNSPGHGSLPFKIPRSSATSRTTRPRSLRTAI